MLTLPLQAHHAMEKMEEFVYKVRELLGTLVGSWGCPQPCWTGSDLRSIPDVSSWDWDHKFCRWLCRMPPLSPEQSSACARGHRVSVSSGKWLRLGTVLCQPGFLFPDQNGREFLPQRTAPASGDRRVKGRGRNRLQLPGDVGSALQDVGGGREGIPQGAGCCKDPTSPPGGELRGLHGPGCREGSLVCSACDPSSRAE